MTDLISRADAIEAVASITMSIHLSDVICNKLMALPSADAVQIPIKLEKRYPESKDEDITDAFMRGYLAGRSSADAEWIPCSERLPSESGDYLCTIPLDVEETYTEVLMFHKGRFYEDDDEWGATYHDDVLAWMPLPKPYKGGAE